MMLWYKAWRESRARFLLGAAVVVGLCAVIVVFQQAIQARIHTALTVHTYAGYIFRIAYAGTVRGVFAIVAPILALGGLQRERAQHTDAFTLALPVSRRALLTARVAVGLLEIVVLSLLPAVVICSLSPFVHESYPWSQALQFSVLWAVVGASGFAAWLLASVIFSGEYTAFTVCWIIAFFSTPLTQRPSLRWLHLSGNYIMSGWDMPYLDPQTNMLIGPFPWTTLSIWLMVAFGFVALAVRILRTQDFA